MIDILLHLQSDVLCTAPIEPLCLCAESPRITEVYIGIAAGKNDESLSNFPHLGSEEPTGESTMLIEAPFPAVTLFPISPAPNHIHHRATRPP